MTIASILFVFEQGGFKSSTTHELLTGLGIVFTGLFVNVICIVVVLEVREIDSKLNLHHKPSAQAGS